MVPESCDPATESALAGERDQNHVQGVGLTKPTYVFSALSFCHVRCRRQSLSEEQRIRVTKRKLGSIDVQNSQMASSPLYGVPYRDAEQAMVIRR